MARYETQKEKLRPNEIISIPKWEQVDNVTLYNIHISLGAYHWTVSHRYSEFHELNEKLVSDHGIDRNLLPPKKLFGSQSESFIQKRRVELESYLQKLLSQMEYLPPPIIKFLHFDKYEIHGLTQALAEELFHKGDHLLLKEELFHITPLQLHALAERLTLPEPTCNSGDKKQDLGHILDFLSQVKHLRICGDDKPVGKSNIIPNNLLFHLLPVRNLKQLQLDGCNPKMISCFENIRNTVVKLQIHDTLNSLKDLLLCDVLHWDPDYIGPSSVWTAVKQADFSYNHLTSIDDSVRLLPGVEVLDLSHNQLSSLSNLDKLAYLSHLDLSHNCFTILPSLYTCLGNVITLNLSGNTIESLKGLSKLYSLVTLDLQSNQIASIVEVMHLSSLPCLENLLLSGNPITLIVDYRTRILEIFNIRSSELCLDNERPTQKELDTVAILQAIRHAKEGRQASNVGHTTQSPTEVEITDRNEAASVIPAVASQPVVNSSCGNPGVTSQETVTEFRNQIEALRKAAGTNWLKLLNERKMKEQKNNQSSIPRDQEQQIPPIKTTDAIKECGNSMEQIPVTNLVASQFPSIGVNENLCSLPFVNIHTPTREIILPEELPDYLNVEFQEYVKRFLQKNKLISASDSSLLPFGIWAVVIDAHFSYNCSKIPSFVLIMPQNILILILNNLHSETGFPQIELHSIVRHDSASNIFIGRHHHFIRFETQQSDGLHIYVLLISSKTLCNNFLFYWEEMYKRMNMPFNVVRESEILLRCSEAPIGLRHPWSFSWVAVDNCAVQPSDTIVCIAVSSTGLNVIRERVAKIRNTGQENLVDIEIFPTLNVEKEVEKVTLFEGRLLMLLSKLESKTLDDESLPEIEFPSNLVRVVLQNSGFGIVMSVCGGKIISCRFPSQENRDMFLIAFTKLRSPSDIPVYSFK